MQNIQLLSAGGIKFALDDFTPEVTDKNCSAKILDELMEAKVPLHQVKFDGKFIRQVIDEIEQDQYSTAMAKIMGKLDAIRSYGCEFVAEWVQTMEEMMMLSLEENGGFTAFQGRELVKSMTPANATIH